MEFTSVQREQRLRAFKLQEEMLSSPEMERVQHLNRLTNSITIFAKNYLELKILLDLICVKPEGMELFFVENRSMWEQAVHELTRLIHNFVAAGVSVVDHAKSLHGRLHRRSTEFSDFPSELDNRVFKNPVAAFMRELRNHFMHIGTPGVGTRLSYSSQPSQWQRQVTISKAALRPDDWNLDQARLFLAGIQTDYIDVVQIIEDYRAVVEDFFTWMSGRLRILHKNDYERIGAYQAEILKLRACEIEGDIRERLAALNRGIGTIIDVLTPFMTVTDGADLNTYIKDLRIWTEEALARIGSMVPLSEALKADVLAAVSRE